MKRLEVTVPLGHAGTGLAQLVVSWVSRADDPWACLSAGSVLLISSACLSSAARRVGVAVGSNSVNMRATKCMQEES